MRAVDAIGGDVWCRCARRADLVDAAGVGYFAKDGIGCRSRCQFRLEGPLTNRIPPRLASSNSPSSQTIARPDPFFPALLGPARWMWEKPGADAGSAKRCHALRVIAGPQDSHVCTREQHTRPNEVPSLAQRGEGGVRGGSGSRELDPTAEGKPETQRDAMSPLSGKPPVQNGSCRGAV